MSQIFIFALLLLRIVQITPSMCLMYIRLMCEFEPANVYKYLSGHSEYPLQVITDCALTSRHIEPGMIGYFLLKIG